MNKNTVLVVEDDKAVRSMIALTLETHDYNHIEAVSGTEAISLSLSYKPDLIILDLGLPDIDGVEVIRKTRTWSRVPIIVVSARTDDRDKIAALDEGADDYLTKPFSVDELLARLRVALRRLNYIQSDRKDTTVFQNGSLKIDEAAGCVYVDDTEIHLAPIEYKLLNLLANNVGKVITHNSIIKEIWGDTMPYDSPSVRVYIAMLRKKLETPMGTRLIQTHPGIGYRMLRIDDGDNA
ncbi:MAG: response regulator transcription factor [Atopobium sp.]|nr:response regulator transcription factor [Atopobium sp.]